jgi:hypothetical protein
MKGRTRAAFYGAKVEFQTKRHEAEDKRLVEGRKWRKSMKSKMRADEEGKGERRQSRGEGVTNGDINCNSVSSGLGTRSSRMMTDVGDGVRTRWRRLKE